MYKGYIRASQEKRPCYVCAHRATNLRIATTRWSMPCCAQCLAYHDFDETLIIEHDDKTQRERDGLEGRLAQQGTLDMADLAKSAYDMQHPFG
jgi:hypothetical protein